MLKTVFRTEDFPPADRFECWHEMVRTSILPTILYADRVSDFRATSQLLDLMSVQVYLSSQPTVQVKRPPRLVRQSDPEFCYVALVMRGSVGFVQARGQAKIDTGDMLLYDSSHAFDLYYTCGQQDPGLTLQVQFPRVLLPHPDLFDRLTGRPIPSRNGLGTVLSGYLLELINPATEVHTDDRAALATITLDLIAGVVAHELRAAGTLPAEVGNHALLNHILEFMRQHLGDVNLCPDMIAAAHHISARYLHKLFQTQDLTVAAWIRQQRLERCRRDLADPCHRYRPIHAVAARWGFTDKAHFSRLFRTRYGLSPSDYRRFAATGRCHS